MGLSGTSFSQFIKGGKNTNRIYRLFKDQKGITGLETAIILIAFVVVASVFAYTTLSSGLAVTDKSKEAINSALDSIQGTLEVRGSIIGHKDTLNSAGNGSLGKVDITVTVYSSSSKVDLTPAYTLDSGTGALTESNSGHNRLQIAFFDHDINVPDCPWTVNWIGANNNDMILDSGEKAVITIWLHDYDGVTWTAGSAGSGFLGSNYVDTYHEFTLELKTTNGATLTLERTTPAYLYNVIDLR